MSMGELIFIGFIILLVVPPEKLPGLARQIARFFNDIRRTTSGVWDELKKDTPNPMEEIRKQKQDAEEYMKFIGSEVDHHKENPYFVKPDTANDIKPNIENQVTTISQNAEENISPSLLAEQKNEPDKK